MPTTKTINLMQLLGYLLTGHTVHVETVLGLVRLTRPGVARLLRDADAASTVEIQFGPDVRGSNGRYSHQLTVLSSPRASRLDLSTT